MDSSQPRRVSFRVGFRTGRDIPPPGNVFRPLGGKSFDLVSRTSEGTDSAVVRRNIHRLRTFRSYQSKGKQAPSGIDPRDHHMKTSDLTLPRVAAPAVLFLALAACDGAKDPQPVAQTPTTEAATDAQATTASSTPAADEATGLTTATSNSAKARTAASTAASTGVSGEGAVTKSKPRSKGSDLTTAAEARQLTVKAPSRPDADSKTEVVFEPETLDLGRMQPGVPKTGIVRLTNNGSAAVQIKKAVASCGCTTPSWPREPILAGETAEIEITLKPSLKQGQRLSKRVTLQMMAGPPQVITVEGEVGVFVKIEPDFLDAAKQESADQQVVVLESVDETPFSIIACLR